jgi:putative phosphotransacetylase
VKTFNKTALLEEITRSVINELNEHHLLGTKMTKSYVPVNISARHIHLQVEHVEQLFGRGYQLKKFKNISQPGQYACQEKVTVQGPNGLIENIRILGPIRKQTQVELASSEARKLGIRPPVRNSGNLEGTAALTLIGPRGKVSLQEGCIIADRHIHMTAKDAHEYGLRDQQKVSVEVEGEKGGIMGQVTIRVNDRYALDMHIDTDDANAFGLRGNEQLKIIPQ